MLIQALVPELAVEAFDKGILGQAGPGATGNRIQSNNE